MSNYQMTIQLQRDLDTGQWTVWKVEVRRAVAKTLTTFRAPIPLDAVFQGEVARYIRQQLPVRTEPTVLSVDNKEFESSPMSFSGIHILAQRAIAGIQAVTIRISEVVGAASAIFLDIYEHAAPGLPQPKLGTIERALSPDAAL